MSTRKIKVGIIGAGNIAQQSHIPAYLTNPNVEIMGVSDLDESKLNEVKQKFNLKKTFIEYKDLIEEGIEAVSICVSTKFHPKITMDCASKGINILCEKPIALTLEEADSMINACEKNNTKLMIGFNYRFIKTHQETKKMMKEGKIGEPFYIHAQFASTGPYKDLARFRNSFYFDPKSGGGVLFDSGSHLFDLLRWYFGEIKTVKGVVGTYTKDIPVADVASVSLEFENGKIGTITCMWTQIENYSAMGNEGFLKIIGNDGKITSSLLGPSIKYYNKNSKICKINGEIELTPKGFDPKSPGDPLQRSWKDEISSFIESIINNKPVSITGYDGKRSLELILQAYSRL